MEHLFFNYNGNLREVKTIFFSSLDLKLIGEGDSSHYLEGIYFSHKLFGVEILLAYNNYGYDDVYNYFVSINTDVLSKIKKNPEVTKLVKDIMLLLLPNALQTEIAYERDLYYRHETVCTI